MTRRRLFSTHTAVEADVRPTLLGVVSLAFLLLFFLLATSSGLRLGSVALRPTAGTPAAEAHLPHGGPVDGITVTLAPDGRATVSFRVQSTDIAAASTAVEQRVLEVTDARALGAQLERLHALDPAQRRARLVPHPDTTTAQLLAALDAIRGTDRAARFPEVALADAGDAPG